VILKKLKIAAIVAVGVFGILGLVISPHASAKPMSELGKYGYEKCKAACSCAPDSLKEMACTMECANVVKRCRDKSCIDAVVDARQAAWRAKYCKKGYISENKDQCLLGVQ